MDIHGPQRMTPTDFSDPLTFSSSTTGWQFRGFIEKSYKPLDGLASNLLDVHGPKRISFSQVYALMYEFIYFQLFLEQQHAPAFHPMQYLCLTSLPPRPLFNSPTSPWGDAPHTEFVQ